MLTPVISLVCALRPPSRRSPSCNSTVRTPEKPQRRQSLRGDRGVEAEYLALVLSIIHRGSVPLCLLLAGDCELGVVFQPTRPRQLSPKCRRTHTVPTWISSSLSPRGIAQTDCHRAIARLPSGCPCHTDNLPPASFLHIRHDLSRHSDVAE